MNPGRDVPRDAKALVLLFFFLSGFCGLIYEVVWVRVAGTVIGNTTYATGTVVAVYMAGLALGAWRGGRWADRRRGGALLGLYGSLEAGIAVSALLVPSLFRASEPVFGALYASLGEKGALYLTLRVLLVSLILLGPTAMMGATLPVLSRFLSGSAQAAPREAGLAYAVNTFGGAAGTLAGGFGLIPAFGLSAATFVAAALNLAIAAGALLLAWRARAESPGAAGSSPVPPEPPPPRGALAVAAAAGFTSLVYEVAWTRSLVLSFGSTVYSFTLILAVFILGLASGSAIASRLAARAGDPRRALALTQAGVGLAAVVLMPFLGDVPVRFGATIISLRKDFGALLAVESGLTALFVFAPAALMGATFPFACRWAGGADAAVGRSVGAVYSWNTLGCIVGTLAASFAIIPAAGLRAAIVAAATVNLALAGVLFAASAPRLPVAAGAAALAIPAAWLLPSWDPYVLSRGVYLYGDRSATQIVAHYWDSYGLVTVHRSPRGHLLLKINGKTDASTVPEDMETQRLCAHLPLLHHPAPRRVLVIGLGGGVTAGTAALHPVERIDCVEISPAVARATAHFEAVSHGVLRDPRFHLTLGDGRDAVRFGGPSYDAIISEPSNLWISGMAGLFTREFLRDAARRLGPGGIFCQWLHAYRLSTEDFRCVVRTFYGVFPHGSVWETIPGGDYIFLGSADPLRRPIRQLEGRLEDPRIARDLEEPGLQTLPSVLGRLVTDADGARAFAGEGPRLTDDHCAIEYTAPRALHRESGAGTITGLDAVRRGPLEERLYEGAVPGLAARREARRLVALAVRDEMEGRFAEAFRALEEVRSRHGLDRQGRRVFDRMCSDALERARAARAAGDPAAAIRQLRLIPPGSSLYAQAERERAGLGDGDAK